MKFGFCCCSSGGIYDIYGLFINPVDVQVTPEYLFYRTPSVAKTGITDGVGVCTSFPDNWYIDLRGSGDVPKGNIISTITDRNNEFCWVCRNSVSSHPANVDIPSLTFPTLELLSGYNNFTNSGWSGSNCNLTTNSIAYSGTGINSGVYIRQTVSGITGAIDEFDVGIQYTLDIMRDKTYNKTLLFTFEGMELSGTNLYVWLNNSVRYNSGLYNGATVLPQKYDLGDYYFDRIRFYSFNQTSTGALKVQLVDDTGLFYLNDNSGFSTNIHSLSFYIESSSYDENLSQIHCLDIQNQVSILNTYLTTGASFSPYITGTDIAKYHNYTGNNLFESTLVTEGDIFRYNNYNKQLYVVSEDTDLATLPEHYISGTLDDYRLIKGNGNYSELGIFNSLATISNGRINGQVTTSSGNKIAFIKMGPIGDFFPSTYNNTATRDGVFDGWDWGSYDGYDNNDLILEINQSGDRRFIFGENFEWGRIELPYFVSGKLNGSDYFHTIEATSSLPNLPRITIFPPKDYPNCFSVKNPQFIVYNPTTSSTVQQIINTTDAVSILYGPYTSGSYTIYNNSSNHTGTGNNPYGTTGALDNRVFALDKKVLYGDEGNSQVFWTDSLNKDRLFGRWNSNNQSGSTGPPRMLGGKPSVGAALIWGDCKNNVPAAIFSHYTTVGNIFTPVSNTNGTGYVEYLTGISYLKVKIGANTVFDRQVYNNPTKAVVSFTQINPGVGALGVAGQEALDRGFESCAYNIMNIEHARGLSAINDSETQLTGVSGIGFGWFERLWYSLPSTGNLTGIPIGWRLHVTDMSGNNLWTMDTKMSGFSGCSGAVVTGLTGTGCASDCASNVFPCLPGGSGVPSGLYNPANFGNPTIMGSSNRFIYIKDFFMCGDLLPDGALGFNLDDSGNYIEYLFSGQNTNCFPFIEGSVPIRTYYGGGYDWAISHDGTTRFPIKKLSSPDTVFNLPTFNANRTLPSTIDVNLGGQLVYNNVADFVNKSELVPLTPTISTYPNETCLSGTYFQTGAIIVGSGVLPP